MFHAVHLNLAEGADDDGGRQDDGLGVGAPDAADVGEGEGASRQVRGFQQPLGI